MNFFILTVFSSVFEALKEYGILGRAIKQGLLDFKVVNLRDFSIDKHRSTDDYTYGGGAGMVMLAEPIYRALAKVREETGGNMYSVLLGPSGVKFDQKKACELAQKENLVLICGHYEGVDARVTLACDEEISLGDFITTGGELPAMVMIDVISRLLPGVLGNEESLEAESFSSGILEYDQYTRPRQLEVPDVLLSGDHGRINLWRLKNSLWKTIFLRPDLLKGRKLTSKEKEILREIVLNLEEILKGAE